MESQIEKKKKKKKIGGKFLGLGGSQGPDPYVGPLLTSSDLTWYHSKYLSLNFVSIIYLLFQLNISCFGLPY